MNQQSRYLFVYGTLKRGERNHALLDGQPLVGEAITERRYRLHDCGPYPALVPCEENGVAVRGEVYLVDTPTFRRLDVLEEVPFLYQMGPVRLQGFGPPVVTYFYQQDVSRFADCGDCWPRRDR